MNANLQEKLERLRNHRTRYEAILIMPDGSRKLFGYCGAKSFSFLIRMAEKKYDDLKAKTGFERFEVLSPKDSKNCEHEFPLIAYSGRTQRSAYCEGELDYFND